LIRKRPTKNQRSPGPWPGLLGLTLVCIAAARAADGRSVDLRLAAELCGEGSWGACLVESRRVLAADPGNAEAAALENRASSGLSCVRGETGRPRGGRVARDLADPSAAFRRPSDGDQPCRTRFLLTAPVRWAILLYRAQIAPALGRRCSLLPSCSEYTLQALGRHGLLGIAMYADRAVREPSVVAEARNPVFERGRRRYADPVEAHDWWMK